jgi:hypothetical protein
MNDETYTVELWTSKAHLPYFFACHPWFIIHHNGEQHRYEVLYTKANEQQGYIHIDTLDYTQGLPIFPGYSSLYWKPTRRFRISGGRESDAYRLFFAISQSLQTYPNKKVYRITGPNSNTYAQWVLNHACDNTYTLPWYAFGKEWNKKRA